MRSEDVSFDSGGTTIAGTWTEPDESARPVAAALLIVGSGRTDRDSDARLPLGRTLRTGVTRAIAQALAGAGVSSLRYDKRGVGASGGGYYPAGIPQQLTDARAALGWLSGRAGGLPLLAIGHSEGTFYAAQLAADGAVAGAVLLSAPERTGGEVLAWQLQQLPDMLSATTKLVLRLMRIDLVKSQRKKLDKIMTSTRDVIRIQGFKVNARWFRDFVAYDPAPVLERITVPVLAVTGGHDMQAPPEDVEAIGRLVKGPFEGHVVGDLSHLLRPDPGPVGPRGYRRAGRQPVSPEVLDLITTWIASHCGGPCRATL
jgi:uncharacterized protein